MAITVANSGSPLLRRAGRGARRGTRTEEADSDGEAIASLLDDGDDIEQAYSRVQRFRTLKEGDVAHVPLSSFLGNPTVHAELVELVELLRDPGRYERVGAQPPKGVLLCGEPGTGKTFAARAVASEAGVPFLALSGSDFRQSPFSGVGTSMVLRMLNEARRRAPCVIFIDEIDSVGETRHQGTGFNIGDASSSKTDQDTTLNAILAQIDGFEPTSGVLFLAATNRPEVLDEALLRSGRFEKRVEFRLPDAEGREDVLRGSGRRLVFSGDGPDFRALARQTAAFSPADLHGLMNGAAMGAARAGCDAVTSENIAASLQDVIRRKAKSRSEGAFQVVDRVSVGFSDVKGHDEGVREMHDLVDMLTDREKYHKLGAVPPRGVLLDGPTGVGKTHCARALAGEVGLPYLSASGSDFQASRFAGYGTQLVKRLFALARKLQPCVVFIDEIDAVGRRREVSARGAEQDRENTMMQLLVEMDGFGERSDVLVLAATNRADVLDPALLRPGRFDRRISLELPDVAGRRAILELYASGKPLADSMCLEELARRTVGLSGAELRNLMNESALRAAKRGAVAVSQVDLEYATDRITLGVEKASPTRGHAARRLAAVHEAGHVVLGFAFAAMTSRRVSRASIRPRLGGVGGVTVFEPLGEDAEGALPSGIFTQRGCCASLCVDLGGRVAEEVMLRPLDVSSGASADLRSATRRAMAMAADWGLGGSLLSLDALGAQCSDATLQQTEQAASSILALALKSSRSVLGSIEGRRCLEVATGQLLESEEAGAEVLSASMDLEALQDLARREAEAWI